MDRQDILRTLKSELAVARRKANEAMKRFEGVIREAPVSGVAQIHKASKALSIAREQLADAHIRVTAFVVRGTIPDHLKPGDER
jgi:hypothetical protein